MKYFILLFATLIGMSSAQASVWTEYNQWSPEWEQRYAEWVRDNWNINVFASRTLSNGQSNPYYGLHTDCADTVYSMRIIFSYENGLPFVINDPTGTGTISNKTIRTPKVSVSRYPSAAPVSDSPASRAATSALAYFERRGSTANEVAVPTSPSGN